MHHNRVTLFRNPPIVASGIVATLAETEFEVVSIPAAELPRWIELGGMVIVGVREKEDLDLIVDLRETSPDGVVITLVADGRLDLARQALHAGAISSIPLDADLRSIALALRAAQSRLSVIPESVSRHLEGPTAAPAPVEITGVELAWLKELAAGATVGDIAEQAGHSERAMFRLLSKLYGTLGADTRIGALIAAAKLGLI